MAITDRKNPISPIGRKSNTSKVLVAIAVEMLQPKGLGRIRIKQIANGDCDNLMPFIMEAIQPDSLIHSDGSGAYRDLEQACYHQRMNRCLACTESQHCLSYGCLELAKEKRDDGQEIPADQRAFEVRWLPPIPVNLPDLNDLPATVRSLS